MQNVQVHSTRSRHPPIRAIHPSLLRESLHVCSGGLPLNVTSASLHSDQCGETPRSWPSPIALASLEPCSPPQALTQGAGAAAIGKGMWRSQIYVSPWGYLRPHSHWSIRVHRANPGQVNEVMSPRNRARLLVSVAICSVCRRWKGVLTPIFKSIELGARFRRA